MVGGVGFVKTEAAVQNAARLLHAQYGPNWRNNSGACQDKTGRLVRYGLGHETKMRDDDPRSSDVIGITPEWAYIERYGWRWVGVLTALEMKPAGWHQVPSDLRAIGQAKWHDIVRNAGGYAGFVTDPADVLRIIGCG
jgi:hypothetical protein